MSTSILKKEINERYLISYIINLYDEMKMDKGIEVKGRKKGEKYIFFRYFIRIWVHTFFIQ